MAQLKGMPYLKKKLKEKKTRVDLRYEYYEQKKLTFDFGISTPPDLRLWMTTLGWCAKAVDSLADRLQFYKFDYDNYGLNEIFAMNNRDTLFDSAILSALISSCCFIYIYTDDKGTPKMQIIDGSNATGVIDPVTGLLTEGYAVLERDQSGNPTLEAYFITGATEYFPKDGNPYTVGNDAPAPLLVPIINRPDAKRPFGHSRISRACMSIQGSAVRTIKRSEIAAEFYSYPQKYITGLSEDAELADNWKASISKMLTFTKDADGESPKLGQFTQQSMQPFTDQLRMFASAFAGETGLTLDDLGFVSDNPTSADAIKASHENLRLATRKAQRDFGNGFRNAGYLAACLRDKMDYNRNEIVKELPVWEPIFEPDISQIGAIADATFKIQQSLPGYLTAEAFREITGLRGNL